MSDDKPDYVEAVEEKVPDLTADERVEYDGKTMAAIAAEIRSFWQADKDLKEELKKANKRFDQLSEYLAERMDTAQMTGFRVDGLGTVFIENKNKPYQNDKDSFFAYLRETNNAGLIKETVHPMALLGLVNELTKANAPLPPGVHNFVLRRAKIRK